MQAATHIFDPGLTVWPRHEAQMRPSVDPEACIGVFDSGVGGLTVASALTRHLARERIVYVADQAHVPYGGRPLPEVRGFAEGLTTGLFRAGAKAVVMGCNISSAVALPGLSKRLPPGTVFGVVEPGARAALAQSVRKRIGVLATEGTVASGAYRAAIYACNPDAFVLEVACPDFVPLVESGQLKSPHTDRAVRHALAPLIAQQVDCVVLGCTHYPFLIHTLRAEAGPAMRFIDPADATAKEVAYALEMQGVLRRGPRPPHRLLTSGSVELFRAQLSDFAPELAGAVGQVRWRP